MQQHTDLESDSYYAPLVGVSSTTSPPSYAEAISKNKKKCGGGCCLILSLLTFLTIFIFLPRAPEISYINKSATFSLQTLSLTQGFSFKNNNYYNMKWQNLELDVFLCNVSETFPFLLLDCDENAVGHATSTELESFTTPSRGSRHLTMSYKLALNAEQVLNIGRFCRNAPGYVVFLTAGEVDARLSSGHKFGMQQVSQYSYIDCN